MLNYSQVFLLTEVVRMGLKILVQLVFLIRLAIFPMFGGFGIITSWPKKRCLYEVRLLKFFFRFLLPKTHFFTEPMVYRGKSLVVFVWRQNDVYAWAFMEENKGMFGAIYDTTRC